MNENASTTADGENEKFTQSQLDALVQLHKRFLDGRLGGRRANLKSIDLSGLSLSGCDLRQSDFTGCIMTNMNLSYSNFQEATLYAVDLSFSNLSEAIFIRADLRGSKIESSDLKGADLEKADLRGGGLSTNENYTPPKSVNFKGADLSGAKLAGTMASKANFSDTKMHNVNMCNADLRGADLEGADMSGAEFTGVQMQGAILKSTILTGVNIDDLKSSGADIAYAITDDNVGKSVRDMDIPLPKKVEDHQEWITTSGEYGSQLDLSDYDLRELRTLKEMKFTAIRAVNTRFFGMNMYKIQLQSSILIDSDFRGCDMAEADLRGSSFKNANLCHANLGSVDCSALMFGVSGGNRFAPCSFDGAKMRYVDFSNANLKNTSFKGADLAGANFDGADISGADFTDAIIEGASMEDITSDDTIFPQSSTKKAFSLDAIKE